MSKKEKVKGKGLLKFILTISIIIVSIVFLFDSVAGFIEFSREYSWQNFYLDDEYNLLEILWTFIRAILGNIFVPIMLYKLLGFIIVQIVITIKKLFVGMKKSEMLIASILIGAIIILSAGIVFNIPSVKDVFNTQFSFEYSGSVGMI